MQAGVHCPVNAKTSEEDGTAATSPKIDSQPVNVTRPVLKDNTTAELLTWPRTQIVNASVVLVIRLPISIPLASDAHDALKATEKLALAGTGSQSESLPPASMTMMLPAASELARRSNDVMEALLAIGAVSPLTMNGSRRPPQQDI